MNAYIAKHWKEFRIQMKPVFDVYIRQLLSYPTGVILTKVPLNKLFLP